MEDSVSRWRAGGAMLAGASLGQAAAVGKETKRLNTIIGLGKPGAGMVPPAMEREFRLSPNGKDWTVLTDADPQVFRPLTASATPAPPRKGEFLTCERGHLIAEVTADRPEGAYVMPYGAPLGHWRENAKRQHTDGYAIHDCECGAKWARPNPPHGLALHIKGRGWV